MKKYIPYFAVFFVILLIVITIEENNDQPSETSAGTLTSYFDKFMVYDI